MADNDYLNKIMHGDALSQLDLLPDNYVDCVCTSPPYWSLRRYNVSRIWDTKGECEHQWGDMIYHENAKSGEHGPNSTIGAKDAQHAARSAESNFCVKCGAWRGELGQEPTYQLYVEHLLQIFDKVKRVLKKSGSCWVVISDTFGTKSGGMDDLVKGNRTQYGLIPYKYEGVKQDYKPKALHKSLLMIPERFAMGMIDHGWILRNKIIWHKKNAMPSSATDRFTIDFEFVFFFTKSRKYFFNPQYEPYSDATMKEFSQAYNGKGLKDYEANGVQNPSDVKRRIIERYNTDKTKYEKENPLTSVGNLRNGSWQPLDDIMSMSKYMDSQANIAMDYTSKIKERAESRELAKIYFPDDIKKQKQFIHDIHEKGMGFIKSMPPIGGNKDIGLRSMYTGNTPEFTPKGRIMRTVWSINTQPSNIKHYAIFPETLVEKILKAACPEQVCSKCKIPRTLEYENNRVNTRPGTDSKYPDDIRSDTLRKREINLVENPTLSSCKCNAEFEPGIVLDPFSGVSTTALVAWKMNRNFVMIEPSQEYITYAEKRLGRYFGRQEKLFPTAVQPALVPASAETLS